MTHLDHEEQEIEPVYLENVDSPAIKEMGKKFAKAEPGPGRRASSPGCSTAPRPQERAALSENIPEPVLAIITALFGRSYRKEVAPVWTRLPGTVGSRRSVTAASSTRRAT